MSVITNEVDIKSTRRSRQILGAEAAITSGLFAGPVFNTFWHDVGMSQTLVGVSQAIFTAALLLLNIPTGWFADKISRKFANALGDLIIALGFVGYAFASNFWWVIAAETVLGIGLAMTHGADSSLLRAYCDRLGECYTKQSGKIAARRPICEMIGVLVGGMIGAHEPRFAIALSALPFVIGAILSMLLDEQGERPGDDVRLVDVLVDCVRIPALRWVLLARMVGLELTHALVWVLTPLLIVAGVPMFLVGAGWALNLAAASAGSRLAAHVSLRLSGWLRFALPMACGLAVMSVLAIHVSLWTVWLFAVLGLVRGWMQVTTEASVRNVAPESCMSTIMSVSGSWCNVLYIVAVMVVNFAASHDIRAAFLVTIIGFTPMVALVAYKLRRHTL